MVAAKSTSIPVFETGMLVLFAATIVHFVFVGLFGGLPRFMGWIFVAGYVVFLWKGLPH